MQLVRGTKDLFGEDIEKYNHIVTIAREIALLYNFSEIMTPIFEFSEVFEKNLGDMSDIVLKEIYKFKDRSDNYLSLRPEFTAGVVRALLGHPELCDRLPIKLFSQGPVFRYDRPQKGRQRQFNQVNFECFGIRNYMGDVDVILLCDQFLRSLGLDHIILNINSLGSEQSRKSFEDSLVKYFGKYKNDLSGDSRVRLENNVLRILDSKDEKDKKLLEDAPKISSYYTVGDKIFFSSILEKLSLMSVEYIVNESLVRGLDYYTSTVFEFVTNHIGAQSAVMGGGRYDKLVNQIGGRDIPAVGCAAGIERLMLLLEGRQFGGRELISIVPISDGELDYCIRLAENLRDKNITCELNSCGDLRKKMNIADRNDSRYTIIIGSDELKSNLLTVRDMSTGTEEKLSVVDLLERFLRG
ncbi:MAG: histidine--tRNA ligase [Rickettsiales bacterium]|nr:histidine--tRNA ligase [Rickettsiales bacterium]